jgi:hypothetical protein
LLAELIVCVVYPPIQQVTLATGHSSATALPSIPRPIISHSLSSTSAIGSDRASFPTVPQSTPRAHLSKSLRASVSSPLEHTRLVQPLQHLNPESINKGKIKPKGPLYKDTARLYRSLNLDEKEDKATMTTYREYIDCLCFGKNWDLLEPFDSYDRGEMHRLSKWIAEKCNQKFGDTSIFDDDSVRALIHRLCLDKKRNATQKVRRRNNRIETASSLALQVCILGSCPDTSDTYTTCKRIHTHHNQLVICCYRRVLVKLNLTRVE